MGKKIKAKLKKQKTNPFNRLARRHAPSVSTHACRPSQILSTRTVVAPVGFALGDTAVSPHETLHLMCSQREHFALSLLQSLRCAARSLPQGGPVSKSDHVYTRHLAMHVATSAQTHTDVDRGREP